MSVFGVWRSTRVDFGVKVVIMGLVSREGKHDRTRRLNKAYRKLTWRYRQLFYWPKKGCFWKHISDGGLPKKSDFFVKFFFFTKSA